MYRFFAWFGFSGKRVLSLLLSLFAVIIFIINPCLQRFLVMVAMLLSTAGDFSMSMGDRPEQRGSSYFIRGALFFAVAHIAYIFAYLAALKFVWPGLNAGSVIAMVLFILGICAMLLLRRNVANVKLWKYCLAYLLIISCSAFVVCTYGLAIGGIRLLCALGAVLFFLSDCVIAMRTFSRIEFFRTQAGRDLVWWLYPIGQVLLIAFV